MLAWFDCASGASGDMLMGALLDAGASLDAVRAAVGAVGVEPITIGVEPVRRAGLAATRALVGVADDAAHRDWSDVRRLLDAAGPGLPDPVRTRAREVFAALAAAEGRSHGVPAEDVHFHEVGALDAIADVVGVCAALHDLGVTRVAASAVAVGSGAVRSAHGRLPVPVPAVVELLGAAGAPVVAGPTARELCTPTGAALLAVLVDEWGPLPGLRLAGSGTGAGTADDEGSPNVVRVLLGRGEDAGAGPTVVDAVLVETNVDDLDPRLWPAVLDRLLEAGADDAWLTPVLMKKGRPAHTLSALTTAGRAAAVRAVVVTETSAIGLRETAVAKHVLPRTESTVTVRGCVVRVKHAWLHGRVVNTQPEHADLAAAAAAAGVPVKVVLAEALARIG